MLAPRERDATAWYCTAGGARAVVVRDGTLPLVALNLRIAAGSRNDVAGRGGTAHAVEHLMFAGSVRRGRGEHLRFVQSHGGVVNAVTSVDWTRFSDVVSPSLAGTVLRRHAEGIAAADTALTDANLAMERTVLVHERRHRVTNVGYGDALERVAARLYPPGSPYGRPAMGVEEEIGGVSVADCRTFLARYYRAPRANLAVVGDVDPDRVADDVYALLGAFAPGAELVPADPAPPRSSGPVGRHREVVRTSLRTKMFLGYRLPSESGPGFAAARLAGFLLGRGPGARLVDRLVRRGIAAHVSVRVIGRSGDASVGLIEIVPADGVSVPDALRAVDEAVVEPPTGREWDRARAVYRAAWLEDLDSIVERSDGLSLSLQLHGAIDPYRYHETWLSTVDMSEVVGALRYWHPDARRVELVYRHD